MSAILTPNDHENPIISCLLATALSPCAEDKPNILFIAIDDLRRLKEAGKPSFLACGFAKPHLPFYAPKKYWDLDEREKIDLERDLFATGPRFHCENQLCRLGFELIPPRVIAALSSSNPMIALPLLRTIKATLWP